TAVDELCVARHAVVRTEAEALGNTRAEAFEQTGSRFTKAQYHFDAFRLLEIDGDRASVAREDILRPTRCARQAIDPDHLRAHVGQHHAAERARPNACKLDDSQAV